MDGQTAVVTGASRGIGRAVALALADAGAHVVICARERDSIESVAEEIAEEIGAGGGQVTASRADVRDEFDVERLMQKAAEVGGGIDVVVANAAVYHGEAGGTPLSAESYAAYDDHLRTNARGAFATIREALPHLADDARVVVVSGAVGREPVTGYGSYAVSKAAAEAVANGFAVDTDLVVGVVDPGPVATNLSGDEGDEPERAAEQFLWAIRDVPAETLDGNVLVREDWENSIE